MPEIVMFTRLPPRACIRRLEESATRDIPVISDLGLSPAVLARVRDNQIRVRYRRVWVQNAFAPRFVGRLVTDPAGTRVEGQFKVNPFVRAFMALWFVLVGAIGSVLFLRSVGTLIGIVGRPADRDWWAELLVGPGLLLGGIGFVRLGKYLGKKDRQEIIKFLEDVLHATDVPENAG